jgi:hypothetical protein
MQQFKEEEEEAKEQEERGNTSSPGADARVLKDSAPDRCQGRPYASAVVLIIIPIGSAARGGWTRPSPGWRWQQWQLRVLLRWMRTPKGSARVLCVGMQRMWCVPHGQRLQGRRLLVQVPGHDAHVPGVVRQVEQLVHAHPLRYVPASPYVPSPDSHGTPSHTPM